MVRVTVYMTMAHTECLYSQGLQHVATLLEEVRHYGGGL